MVRFSEEDSGIRFQVKVQPNAKKTEILGEFDGALKIKISSPPVENAANKACIELLAKSFGLTKRQVHVVSGKQSKLKTIYLEGLSKEAFLCFLTRVC